MTNRANRKSSLSAIKTQSVMRIRTEEKYAGKCHVNWNQF